MDDRGRLAQSLKRKDATHLRLSARSLLGKIGRMQRLARHWLAPIVEANPPRGTGALVVAFLFIGIGWYGAVKGGRVAEFKAQLHLVCDNLASAAGMRVSALEIAGNGQISREDILAQAAISGRSALPCIDAAAVRQTLLENPWLREATVLKFYPGCLRIEVVERAAIALWQKDGAVSVIAADGTVLEPFTGGRFAALPLIVGSGAERAGNDMLKLVSSFPDIRDQTEALVLIAERRWNMRMRGGIEVRLPEHDTEAALRTLVRLNQEKGLLTRDVAVIDMRQADRVTVRLSDAAAASREEAIKESIKAKAKKKGGAA